MIHILSNIRNFLWGYFAFFILFGYGIFFSFKTKLFPFTAFRETFSFLINFNKNKAEGITPLMSLSTALGGTIGIGSIIGVAYSIQIGGCGVIFWMWISGIIGMMTKFSECSLAIKYRETQNNIFIGGTPYILKKSGYKLLASTFAVLCIISSFGTGNITQVNGLSPILLSYGFKTEYIAIFGSLIIFLIIFKGQRLIGKVNEILMPLASIVYIILISLILINNISSIPNAFQLIIKDAFGFNAIGGGFFANYIIRSFRVGFSKGVFSHEAGMGTSPIAHASNNTATPFSGGVLGIFEVFFDTFIVGTMTGIALISSGEFDVLKMFKVYFGDFGETIITTLLVVFVIAAMISWCFYAESCFFFLKAKKWIKLLYRVTFSFTTIIGLFISSNEAWIISDILNISMLLPNIYILTIKNKEVINIIENNKRITLRDTDRRK